MSPSVVAHAHDLGGLDGIHLLRPPGRRLELSDRAHLVQTVARDADVKVSLQDNLNVTNVQSRIGSDLGQTTSLGEDRVDEFVGFFEEGLESRGSNSSPDTHFSTHLFHFGAQALATTSDLANQLV